MRIIVENSVWANVGNGWYQYSLFYMLKKLFPEHDVIMGEGPINLAFRIRDAKQQANALNWMEYQRADIHVFSGPMMSDLDNLYFKKIVRLKERGENYALISCSGTGYSPSRISELGVFLKKYPPLFMSTRDEETYNAFKPFVPNSYNGICTAFLVDKNIDIRTYKMDKPFFISSFYREEEPLFIMKDGTKPCSIENIEVKHRENRWRLPYSISRHLNYKHDHQNEIGGLFIVRTVQGLSTRFNHINFAAPNSFISFNPLSYLEIVKSSEFTISDRVHACAVSLACGHPARFLFSTPRAGIFDRIGFDYKSNNGIMYPNPDKIDDEFEKLIAQIRKYIG